MKNLLNFVSFLFILTSNVAALNFTIAGGQIFTPGFAVLDAPQPGTPLGGDTIEVALDVTANGKLRLPPYSDDSPSRINNITIFLYSYATGRNFTITNGTASTNDVSLGDIMQSEPGSTVKHVKWNWPDCLIGDGKPDSADSDRGDYNISIRQNFRLNGEDHYTIFDVPISVTNKIDFTGDNPPCDSVNNPLLTPGEIDADAANTVGVLFAPGDATVVQQPDSGGDKDGIGPSKPEGNPADGLGSDANVVGPTLVFHLVMLLSVVYSFIL
ncbi:uncharacterized protein F4822DRAFT_417232 [Hypoxylon trugodes]|uniref:uncharacterized protein n=1 Tax=Hypoxylon trugodes TaxID=326681 RepID=UPI0021982D64|nr:uncharacterized protein F4822DRAFT_417232 [Hypoxylon trugodes]KAI1385079.1 hypothetical protein F4822DRAFT_417232 [Hypoxylon trugodes]